MFEKKKCKLVLVSACVMALVLPYATPTLAAIKAEPYKQSDFIETSVINLANTKYFPNARSTYEMPIRAEGLPDGAMSRNVYSMYVENKTTRNDAIYCLNGEKLFPGVDDQGNVINGGVPYKNFGDFFDASNKESEVYKYVNDSKDGIGEDNYKAVKAIINSMYLQFQDDADKTQYKNFMNKVFGDFINENNKLEDEAGRLTLDQVASLITLDDIMAIQQCAMWYYTNHGFLTISENSQVDITKYTSGYDYSKAQFGLSEVVTKYKIPTAFIKKEGNNADVLDSDKRKALDMLLSYLLTAVNKEYVVEQKGLPEFGTSTPVVTVENNDYKVGPFEINGSFTDKDAQHYKITVNNGTAELAKYVIKDDKNEVINSIQETVGKKFYIYVPTSEQVSSVKVGIQYFDLMTQASFWERIDKDGKVDYTYQPLVWITKDAKEPTYKEVPIERSDLALRKYIVSVNGDEKVARKPVVDATGLTKDATTAIYKHKKSPIEVSSGDKIVYELRVYNEGKTSATVTSIKDFIPAGLELVSAAESKINSTYSWNVVDGVATIDVNKTLNAINAEKINAEKDTLTGGLDTVAVQIELKVKSGVKADSVLTNVAEIANDNINDADSNTSSIKKEDINESTFSGNKENKTDLNDQNYYYKGIEDDDDFEKIKIEGKVFDLALEKFITQVNGKAENREPKVDVKSLQTSTNATYTVNKAPVVVEKGDIVTYKIRVYNEGDLDAYAEEIADYIPEGLGFIVNHKVNVQNNWSIKAAVQGGAKTVKLSTIDYAKDNLKLTDFENTTSLDEVEVVTGLAKITTNKLSSSVSKSNLIKGFNPATDKTLTYKDVEVVCVVLADEAKNNNLKNIAEVTDDSTTDDKGNPIPVEDRDSTPNTVNPNDYPGKDKNQDDNDFEDLTMEVYQFDMALQKYITAVDGQNVDGRAPVITTQDGKIQYTHSQEPLAVGNGDLVEYTIQVYNEGNRAGYAAQIADDLPKGLTFVVDNEVNKKYGWTLVDKFGQVTTDVNQAATVRTNYLSKAESEKRNENNLIQAFDGKNLDSRFVKIVFQVNEAAVEKTVSTEKRTIINTAEITEETDEKGRPVVDIDSTPDNWKDGEDDLDREKIYVKYFDLSLKKDLVKVLVIENGNTTEYNVNDDQLFKVEIHKKKLSSTVVKFVYNITVKNEGEIAGYAKEVKDYIPAGLEFVSDDNKNWYKLGDNEIATDALANTLLQKDETASVQVTLKWVNGENNLGKKVNVAEISKDENEYGAPDIDSTPNNKVPGEDDIDEAPVVLGIITGSDGSYTNVAIAVTIIMISGLVLIKKFVL